MIRESRPEDVSRLIDMGMRFLSETSYREIVAAKPERLADTILNIVNNPDGVILVADDDGRAVGMIAMLAYDHPFSGQRTAFEVAWWIEPEVRGNGAGIALLRAAEDWARARDVKAMQMVAPTPEVGALYERLGYRAVETSFQRSL